MSIDLTITVEGTSHGLDLQSFRLSEADELKRLTGWSRSEWITALFEDHPDAIRFAWMLANRRAGTPLEAKFSDIDFDLADLKVEINDTEPARDVDGVEGDPDLPTSPGAG